MPDDGRNKAAATDGVRRGCRLGEVASACDLFEERGERFHGAHVESALGDDEVGVRLCRLDELVSGPGRTFSWYCWITESTVRPRSVMSRRRRRMKRMSSGVST